MSFTADIFIKTLSAVEPLALLIAWHVYPEKNIYILHQLSAAVGITKKKKKKKMNLRMKAIGTIGSFPRTGSVIVKSSVSVHVRIFQG